MADLFFPPEVPTLHEINKISITRYYVKNVAEGDFCVIQVLGWANSQPSLLGDIQLPIIYHTHLRHFLWRHHVFMELNSRTELVKDGVVLSAHIKQTIQKYIWYMDAIGGGLMASARFRTNRGRTDFRCNLFDLYLLVEYYVGRHEHDVVYWVAFYKEQDDKDDIWSGARYQFITMNVKMADEWQALADRVARFLGGDIEVAPTRRHPVTLSNNESSGSGNSRKKSQATQGKTTPIFNPWYTTQRAGLGRKKKTPYKSSHPTSSISGLRPSGSAPENSLSEHSIHPSTESPGVVRPLHTSTPRPPAPTPLFSRLACSDEE
ncbi:hypothetical protein JVU11DRAFT_9292 [Chiua virens]|nr:hypothetical protein JVU11DRAFT_9292 [Chiua virens]